MFAQEIPPRITDDTKAHYDKHVHSNAYKNMDMVQYGWLCPDAVKI